MLNIVMINEFFKHAGEKILTYRFVCIFLFLLLLITAAMGLKGLRSEDDMDNWFLEDDALLSVKERFEEIFGNNDYCAVLVEADNVFAPSVLEKIREMGRELVEKVPYSDDIVSLTDFEYTYGTEEGMEIIDLVPDPVPRSPEALARIKEMAMSKPAMKNRIVSEDGTKTWIMMRMKPIPDDWEKEHDVNPEETIGRLVTEIAAREKYKELHPRTTGLPIINYDKRLFFLKETPRLFGISLIFTVIVLGLSLRSVRGVVFPLVTAVSSMVIVFGAQGYMKLGIDTAMIFMPVFLGLAVAIGYSIHVFNYFKRGFYRTGDRHGAIVHAVEETGWPLLFSALTTIAALLSFMFIPLRPIRWTGLTAAGLVAVTYLLIIVLLPVLLSFGKNRTPHPVYEKKGGRLIERMMGNLGGRVLSKPMISVVVFLLATIFCIMGITRLEVSADMRRTYGLKVPYVNKLDYIGKTEVGSLYSYDVALEFSSPGEAKDPENLKKFEQLTGEVKNFRLTKKVSSILDIIKDMNQVLNNGDPSFYSIPETREMIAQLLLLYENAGGVESEKWVDYDYQRLRLMVEVDDYNSAEIYKELEGIRKRAAELFPEAKVLLIGSISQFSIMMDYVTWGQIKSFAIAIVVILILMSAVFGSIKTGLIGMIPNISPALAVGGIMGFAGIPLDMMTVTIMPMLLGLAVDDTIHFINHSQLEYTRTGTYRGSTERVFVTVGTALFLTSLVLILNFSAYLFSNAKIFVNLGMLVAMGILAALAADYFMTPVLLNRFKPFGKENAADAQ
jgi:uncharacterized protein